MDSGQDNKKKEVKRLVVLKKGERADRLYGLFEETISPEDIKALVNGQRLYLDVNGEYAVVIRYKKTKPKKEGVAQWIRLT